MSRFLAARYAGLEEYVPGEQPRDQQYIKLNTNESPYPPSRGVLEAVNTAEVARLNLYSDPDARDLTAALAAQYGVGPENVFLSNGSDDILNFCFMAFCADGVLFPAVSYGFYPVYANLEGKLDALKASGYNLFWIAIGKDDFLYEPNQAFMRQMDKQGLKYQYVETTRGHIWANWRAYLLQFAPLLFK